MSSIETMEKPTQTDIKLPTQRTAEEELPQEINALNEEPHLPKPGIGDFDLERGRSRLTNVARLSGYLVLGPRIHVRRM